LDVLDDPERGRAHPLHAFDSLQEARLRLLTNPRDIAGVGYSVGYGSASQFSREYRRELGLSPRLDAVRLRDLQDTPA
jgi:transcriptional regulator GlxA family with amidase domain